MIIRTDNLAWPLSSRLRHILQDLSTDIATGTGVTINFRDPFYDSDAGGYHPVEFGFDRDGHLLYVTDFAFVGRPPYTELTKEIDFDFSCEVFGHLGIDYPIKQGFELFNLWQSNFVAYFDMGVFDVTIEPV